MLLKRAVITSGLSAGLSLSHVLEIPGKHTLMAPEFVHVHHTFYFGYAIFGAVAWIYGLVAGVVGGLALYRVNERAAIDCFAAAAGFAVSLAIFFIFLERYNEMIADWGSDVPVGWELIRNRWEVSHTIIFLCGVFSFISFSKAVQRRSKI